MSKLIFLGTISTSTRDAFPVEVNVDPDARVPLPKAGSPSEVCYFTNNEEVYDQSPCVPVE